MVGYRMGGWIYGWLGGCAHPVVPEEAHGGVRVVHSHSLRRWNKLHSSVKESRHSLKNNPHFCAVQNPPATLVTGC